MSHKNRIYSIIFPFIIAMLGLIVLLASWQPSQATSLQKAQTNLVAITNNQDVDGYRNIRFPYLKPTKHTLSIDHDCGSWDPTCTERHAIDFQMSAGESVHAVHGGKVVLAEWVNGTGNVISVEHEDGYCSVYYHLGEDETNNGFHVAVDDIVHQGQFIADAGCTGFASCRPGNAVTHVAIMEPSGCTSLWHHSEVPMIFDEKPSGTLTNSDDNIESKNVATLQDTLTFTGDNDHLRNLVHNGNFEATANPQKDQHWQFIDDIGHAISDDYALEFWGMSSTITNASVTQDIHYRIPPNSPFEITLKLENLSGEEMREVGVGLHGQGAGEILCDYALQTGDGLLTYKLRGVVNDTSETWDNLRFEVWARDFDDRPYIRMDDVTIEYLDLDANDIAELKTNPTCGVAGMVHNVSTNDLGVIENSRINNGIAEYYVNWADPSLRYNTWENPSNIEFTPVLFSDADETETFFYFIQLLRFADIINGYSGTPRPFKPDESMDRQGLSKYIANTLDLASNSFSIGACDPNYFSDVDIDNKFCAEIISLAKAEIIQGDHTTCDENGENCAFDPEGVVNRGAIAKFVANSLEYIGKISIDPPTDTNKCPEMGQTSIIFDDVNSDTTFCNVIYALANENIINGATCSYNSGLKCFLPDAPVKRGEASKFIANSGSLLDATADLNNYPTFDKKIACTALSENATGFETTDAYVQYGCESSLNTVNRTPTAGSDLVWYASDSGLEYYSYDGSVPNNLNIELTNLKTTAVTGSPLNNNLWVGTYTGAYQYDGTNWIIHTTPDLPDNQVNDITIADTGMVWIATRTGIASYDGSLWTTHPLSQTFSTIAVDNSNQMWGITNNDELGYFDGTTWTAVSNSPANLTAIDILDNTIMLGTSSGLVQYNSGVFTPISPDVFGIKTITHDSEGQFWVVTDYGNVGVYDPVVGDWVVSLPDGPLSYLAPDPADIFNHLNNSRRLHQITTSPDYAPGTFTAPDSDWAGSDPIPEGEYQVNQSHALHMQNVAVYRTAVQDPLQQDIAWETASILDIFDVEWDRSLSYTVLDDNDISAGELANVDILVIPAFTSGYVADVEAALGMDGLAELADFVQNGGTVYAQGQAQALLESAGILPAGTVDVDTPLQLPGTSNLGTLTVLQSAHPLSFNWESERLYLLDDPTITVPDNFQAIAEYSDTIGGVQPAIVYGEVGNGEVILMNGHPTSPIYPDQRMMLFDGILMGMSERGELHGRAIQTYDGNVPDNLIPAYEDDLPISVTLHYDNLWQGITLTDSIIEERVQVGFNVVITSITPPTEDVTITVTNGVTETIIRWDIGNAPFGSQTFQYIATTDLDSLATGNVIFSQGAVSYDDGQAVSWAHPDFILLSLMPARLVGEHDNEPDRYFTIPEAEDGLYIDEFIYLENKEHSLASNLHAMRYIPLIVPIVGLEDQREPLTTNAGETVWMKNMLFAYDDTRYPLPVGMNQYTETWGLEMWDGVTVVTMTTPGGYHIDPLPVRSPSPGFFVTIPPTYSHMITVTAAFELLLPAMKVEWELGDFPGYWYEMPAIRYGIHSTELFSRPVSFTGDPFVDTVVVDATGGSIYTGSGSDPRSGYRDYLADVEVHPPTPPITTGLTYQDVWSRTHEIPIRANFVDVFNFASCGGCGGNSEHHAALNVTFGIWADTDGDEIGDVLLTDFDEMKGVMPTRLTGDLVILIKSRNLGTAIGVDENVIDGRIFRGLGYSITPSNITWENSYTSTYSTLITETRDGGYDQLIFQQEIPINATDLITINAKFDPTAANIEGMLKLHDGVRFIYRQQFAGPGQYEISDTHVQSIIGERTDMELDSRVMPVAVSTYGDTLFVNYTIGDENDWVTFDMDPYMESWGYGRLAATTYVGGRDKMELLHSIVSLGDRTWLRVEINNNDGDTLTDVELFPIVPEGITATAVFTNMNNLPMPLWPDLPFLHLENIPDTAYGIYYFELQISETITELQGQVLEIPFTFSAGNAPEGFEIPPAKLAIRHADGHAPSFISGAATKLLLRDIPEPTMEVLDIRLLTDAEADMLRQFVVTDAMTVPNTHLAEAYFNTVSTTVPYTIEERSLSVAVPTALPWLPDGESTINLVAYEYITTTQAIRQPINDDTNIEGLDSFEQTITDTTPLLYVDARGAAVRTTIITHTIIDDGGEGESIPMMYVNEWHQVVLEITTGNWGNDVAVNTWITVTLGDNFTPILYPENVYPFDGGLLIDMGDLGPGASKSVEVTFDVYAEHDPRRGANAVGVGEITAVSQSDGEFINAYSGAEVIAQTGGVFIMPLGTRSPIGWQVFLPTVMHNFVSAPDLVVTAVNVTTNQVSITIENQGNAVANDGCTANINCFWVDVYFDPSPIPTQVNEIWNDYAATGAAWEVTRVLAPGEQLTLTMNDSYYSENRSHMPLPFALGAQVYAQVDSYNEDTTYGFMYEQHEMNGSAYNNVMGPVAVTEN